jgi:hypothetical protein
VKTVLIILFRLLESEGVLVLTICSSYRNTLFFPDGIVRPDLCGKFAIKKKKMSKIVFGILSHYLLQITAFLIFCMFVD